MNEDLDPTSERDQRFTSAAARGLTGVLLTRSMSQVSRRGLLGLIGKTGLVLVASGAGLNMAAQRADAIGCPDGWGTCSQLFSVTPWVCGWQSACSCPTAGACGTFRAHLWFFLGIDWLPNYECPQC